MGSDAAAELDGTAITIAASRTVLVFPRSRSAAAGSPVRAVLAEVADVPVVRTFAGLDRWLRGLPSGLLFDGERLWPVADLREAILDLRLYPDHPELWARLPPAGGLRAAVQGLLDDRCDRVVRLLPPHAASDGAVERPRLGWLRIGDGLTVRLGHERAMVLEEAAGTVLRFPGGERHPLRPGANRIGRAPDSDVCPARRLSISRDHAVITLMADGVMAIGDLGSRNGTAVECDPARLFATLTDDLCHRGGRDQDAAMTAPMVAHAAAAARARLPLTFADDAASQPSADSCAAVAQAVAGVTRNRGLRGVVAALLLAKSVHRPEEPDLARLWPDGLNGIRWSDGLFLDVFGAVGRNPRLRPLMLRGFRPRAADAWEVRFAGAEAVALRVSADEIAARRRALCGDVDLADGDLAAAAAYAQLLATCPQALARPAACCAGDRVRQVLRCLLGPAVVAVERTVAEPGLPSLLDQDAPLRLLFAVSRDSRAGAGEIHALGRVGVGAAWIELIDPRARVRRQSLPIDGFRRRFPSVVVAVATPADRRREGMPPSPGNVHWGAFGR